MKWIKLFESFDNLEKKINFINDAYRYFEVMLKVKRMNLQKFETKDNIYFYTTTSLNKKILIFVFCKQNRHKMLNKALVYSTREGVKLLDDLESVNCSYFIMWRIKWNIYEKVLEDIFSEYTKEARKKGSRKKTLKKIGASSYVEGSEGLRWQIFENAFKKLKIYKS